MDQSHLLLDLGRTPATMGDAFQHALNLSLDVGTGLSAPGEQTVAWVMEPVAGKASRWRAQLDESEADGWWRIETWLEHHYFTVIPAEDDFGNDIIEIDTSIAAPTPLSGSLPAGSSPDNATDPAHLMLRWFRYRQALAAGGATAQAATPPPKIFAATLAAGLRAWLAAEATDNMFLLRPHAIPTDTDYDAAPTDGFRAEYQPNSNPASSSPIPKLDITHRPAGGDGSACGIVVAADLLVDHKATTTSTSRRARVLRVSVLADPWHRHSVRARIRRNDSLGQRIIDARFLMVSQFSPWHARSTSHFALVAAGDWAAWGVPPSEQALVLGVTGKDWYQSPDPKALGTPLSDRLKSTFAPPGGGAPLNWWNVLHILTNGRAMAVLRQLQPDRHVIGQPVAGFRRVTERDAWFARLVVREDAAADIDDLLQRSNDTPTAIGFGEMQFDVTWVDGKGRIVARVVWPLKFKA